MVSVVLRKHVAVEEELQKDWLPQRLVHRMDWKQQLEHRILHRRQLVEPQRDQQQEHRRLVLELVVGR